MSLTIDRTRVRVLMERAGIETLTDLAERAGLHQNTLTKILRGEEFRSTTAEKLAKALSCNPVDLQVAEGFPDPNLVALALS